MRTLKFPKPKPRPRRSGWSARGALALLGRGRRALVRKADGLWRLLIRAKEPSGVCPVCRRRRWSDAMHCFNKGPYPGLRFEVDNGAPGCRPCHRRIDSDHLAKEEFFRRYIGNERYERLRLMAQAHTKTDLQLVILHLEGRLKAAPAPLSTPNERS